jgi:hypothetical protein
MNLRPSFPDVVVGQGFQYKHVQTGSEFISHTLDSLHKKVGEFCKANNFQLNNDEFYDNVCRNTPNIVCTDKIRGLGDVLHVVLNPISKTLDAIAGTNTQGCGGCRSRQEALNNL